MAEKKKLKNIKRFGARYGRTNKYRFGEIEVEQRKKHKCPYCNSVSVKRVSAGIWACRKCSAKFTGDAYSLSKRVVREDIEAKSSPDDGKSIKDAGSDDEGEEEQDG